MTEVPIDDIRNLNPSQLDALREVANIGAGHAATALSQMTGSTILIAVPRLKVVPLEELSLEIGPPEEPVAAVLMAMLGDITGRTLLVFPRAVALRLASILTRRNFDLNTGLGALGESALKEAGNILSGAYLNALSEFMGMMLLNSPPDLAIDMSAAVLTSEELEFGMGGDYVFCVESEFVIQGSSERLRGFFLLLPDPPSLRVILKAVRLA
ncbi:MAG TPA: chemotaxis protein CheC [Gemmatimonadaceae bacterium]|nr:chemotaxis protein CheC [Gemmatimonadaceae bacterium]